MKRPPSAKSNDVNRPKQQPQRRTLWDIYKAVQPRYRILLGMGFMGFSLFGLWASDKLENMYPPPAESRVTHVIHGTAAQNEDSSKRNKP
ncbi:hypothetical protein IW140_004916 [Coemansia sp. RSA 1813]|nr:hypothetical protein EV178_005209 [Coemansia sp. RSA 1646]KAJ1771923.1 hypothetical protein LPJ74_001957 [Coemansia sp. RSA 1843]KAJ2087386.1 hypothetical protein IW138_005003 [Coemansia sp. RSA 986]KAJ2212257.1 hypothetical protein EV179_004808 [Coemansia sp. RSA 487]KAJ2566447.1 hypothetical protein IW140_004916 [Coemansia sp. RSA 1813]